MSLSLTVPIPTPTPVRWSVVLLGHSATYFHPEVLSFQEVAHSPPLLWALVGVYFDSPWVCTLDSTCGPSMGLPQASRSHCDPEQGECDQVTLLLSQWGSRHSKASLRKLVAKWGQRVQDPLSLVPVPWAHSIFLGKSPCSCWLSCIPQQHPPSRSQVSHAAFVLLEREEDHSEDILSCNFFFKPPSGIEKTGMLVLSGLYLWTSITASMILTDRGTQPSCSVPHDHSVQGSGGRPALVSCCPNWSLLGIGRGDRGLWEGPPSESSSPSPGCWCWASSVSPGSSGSVAPEWHSAAHPWRPGPACPGAPVPGIAGTEPWCPRSWYQWLAREAGRVSGGWAADHPPSSPTTPPNSRASVSRLESVHPCRPVSWKAVFPRTGSGVWFGDDSSALRWLCTLSLSLWHQLHLRSSGIRSQRLETPAVDHLVLGSPYLGRW